MKQRKTSWAFFMGCFNCSLVLDRHTMMKDTQFCVCVGRIIMLQLKSFDWFIDQFDTWEFLCKNNKTLLFDWRLGWSYLEQGGAKKSCVWKILRHFKNIAVYTLIYSNAFSSCWTQIRSLWRFYTILILLRELLPIPYYTITLHELFR